LHHLPLTVARITARIDVIPKSLTYYARRELFAAKYYPNQYADWEIGPNILRLVDHGGERRMTLDSSYIAIEAENVTDVVALRKHVVAADIQPKAAFPYPRSPI
jgi:hypothetical protein